MPQEYLSITLVQEVVFLVGLWLDHFLSLIADLIAIYVHLVCVFSLRLDCNYKISHCYDQLWSCSKGAHKNLQAGIMVGSGASIVLIQGCQKQVEDVQTICSQSERKSS